MKGFVVGATSATPSTYAIPSAKANDPTQGMTKAQKKNYQRKLKKLEEKSARNWDSEDEESEEEAEGSAKAAKPTKTYAVKEVKTDEEPDDRFDIHEDSDDARLDKAINDIEVPELGVKPEFGIGFNKYRDPQKGAARPPRPGGIFRDLGLRPKSTSGEAEDKVVLAEPVKPTKPTSAPATKPAKRTVPGADPKAAAKDAPRQRPEVRVRPGHGLAGMMKQLAIQDSTSVRR